MDKAIRSSPREERITSGPAIAFAIPEEIERLRNEPEWAAGRRSSITIVKSSNLSIVLMAIPRGATLPRHQVEGPITLQVVSGTIQLGVAGNPRKLTAGSVIALDKAIPHDVEALEDSDLLLTIVKDVH